MPRPRQLSLRRQLLIWLLLPQLVLWLAAAMLAHAMAVRYANEVIDQTLAQTSRALARQVKPFARTELITTRRARSLGERSTTRPLSNMALHLLNEHLSISFPL